MKPDRTIPPRPHAIKTLALPAESIRVLPNGVTLHSFGCEDQRIVSLILLFSGGAAELSNSCVQTLYGRTLFEGTTEHGAVEVAEILDYHGARCATVADAHNTGLRVAMLTSHVKPLLELLAEVLMKPAFGAAAVEAAKTTEAAHLKYMRSRVSEIATEALLSLIAGPGHIMSVMLTEADVKAVTPSILQDFHRRLVRAGGAHAYVSGDLNDEVLGAVESFLMRAVPSGASITPNFTPYTSEAPQRKDIDRPTAEQCAIAMAIPQIPRSHPDYHNLRLTIMGLGGYFGSRLMSNIRENRGLTYGIGATLKAEQCGSYMDITAQCSSRNVDVVIEEVKKEMCDMLNKPPQGEELERLRRHAYTEALETLDTPCSILNHYSLRVTLGMPEDYFFRQQQAIAALSSDVIATTAAQYLDPSQLRIVVAGNMAGA